MTTYAIRKAIKELATATNIHDPAMYLDRSGKLIIQSRHGKQPGERLVCVRGGGHKPADIRGRLADMIDSHRNTDGGILTLSQLVALEQK
ncbi:MAG: hypothetical protein RL095_3693 [Verrucomicrobiota bacterium]|jgi:hypothetical protein